MKIINKKFCFYITLNLLVVLCVSCSKSNPRKSGIGLRAGLTTNSSTFSLPNVDDNATQIYSDFSVNNKANERFPLFYQSDENLVSNWAYSLWYIDLIQDKSYNIPPVLNDPDNKSYLNLINDSDGQSIVVKSSQTNINTFQKKYPEYNSIIDAASEPSLSADTNLNAIILGKAWGVFIPVYENFRINSLGLGLGISYTEGYYDVNLCDPYIITGNEINPSGLGSVSTSQRSREGLCSKKYNLDRQRISHFGASLAVLIKVFQYIGESFELTLGELDIYASIPIIQEKEKVLESNLSSLYTNLISTVIYF